MRLRHYERIIRRFTRSAELQLHAIQVRPRIQSPRDGLGVVSNSVTPIWPNLAFQTTERRAHPLELFRLEVVRGDYFRRDGLRTDGGENGGALFKLSGCQMDGTG